MSFVSATPDRLGAAARNLAGIGSTLNASNAAAAAPTLAVSAAASDQVSAAVAAFFSGHARGYQTLSAQAERFHTDFVQALSAGANTYASAESANAAPLQQLRDATPDTPSLGNGEAAKTGTGAPGTRSGIPSDAGGTSVTTADPRVAAALEPAGIASDNCAGTGSSTEAGALGGYSGTSGLLLRAAGLSASGVRWSSGAAGAGASGGLLRRLANADGGYDLAGGSGRIIAGPRIGGWLGGIPGAGLALRGGAAGGSATFVLRGTEAPVIQRGASGISGS